MCGPLKAVKASPVTASVGKAYSGMDKINIYLIIEYNTVTVLQYFSKNNNYVKAKEEKLWIISIY